jgi:hypothetical protein
MTKKRQRRLISGRTLKKLRILDGIIAWSTLF